MKGGEVLFRDLAGQEVAASDLVAPATKTERQEWAIGIIDRYFSLDAICSAQLKLVEPLLTILLDDDLKYPSGEHQHRADLEGAEYISQALADLACVAAATGKITSLPGLRLRSILCEDVEPLGAAVASEFQRTRALLDRAIEKYESPTLVSVNLFLIASVLELRQLGDAELRKHMVAASTDRDLALRLCTLLGAKPRNRNFVRQIRESSRRDVETWGGATAAAVLVVWGSDEFSFDDWKRVEISRLWEEAALRVGAMNSVCVLSIDRQIRVIERLLEWRISEPGNPLDLALQLLKARFAPDLLVLSWKDTFRENVRMFTFGPHRNLPVTRPLSIGQMHSLEVIANCPILYGQKTNLWHLFGLPETSEALSRFLTGKPGQ